MTIRLTALLVDGRVWVASRYSMEIIECDECGTVKKVWHFTSNHPAETGMVFHCVPCLRDGFDREFVTQIIWDY